MTSGFHAQTLQTAHTVVTAMRRLQLSFMFDYGLSLGDRNRDLYLSQSVALYASELVIKRRNSLEFLSRDLRLHLCFSHECVTAVASNYRQSNASNYFYLRLYYFYRIIYIHNALILLLLLSLSLFLRGDS